MATYQAVSYTHLDVYKRQDDYFAAREYIETISTSEGDLLSDQELGELWADIQTTNIKNDKIKHKNFFLIGLTAAASVAILVGSFFLLKNYQAVLAPDIATFAVQTKTELPATEETLLILAEDKVVSLKEKETTITYDSVAIKANEENISKKELAVYNQLVIPRGKRSVLTFSDGSKAVSYTHLIRHVGWQRCLVRSTTIHWKI